MEVLQPNENSLHFCSGDPASAVALTTFVTTVFLSDSEISITRLLVRGAISIYQLKPEKRFIALYHCLAATLHHAMIWPLHYPPLVGRPSRSPTLHERIKQGDVIKGPCLVCRQDSLLGFRTMHGAPTRAPFPVANRTNRLHHRGEGDALQP